MATRTKSVTVTKNVVSVHCDVCGASMGRGGHTCCGCDKDICDDCKIVWFLDPFWDHDNGDYPEHACPDCHEAMKSYSVAAQEATEVYERTIMELYDNWKLEVNK